MATNLSPDKLCELLLLDDNNGILQQLTSVSHGFCVNSFVGSGSRPSQSSDHRSGKGRPVHRTSRRIQMAVTT